MYVTLGVLSPEQTRVSTGHVALHIRVGCTTLSITIVPPTPNFGVQLSFCCFGNTTVLHVIQSLYIV